MGAILPTQLRGDSAMTMAELDRMLDMGRRTETPTGARDHALALVAARSGWGVSRLTRLMVSDLAAERMEMETVERSELWREVRMVWGDGGLEWREAQQEERRQEWLTLSGKRGRWHEEKDAMLRRWGQADKRRLTKEVVVRVRCVGLRWTRRYALIDGVPLDTHAAESLWRWLRFRMAHVENEGYLFCTISRGTATGHGAGGQLVPGRSLNPSQVRDTIGNMGAKAGLGRVTPSEVAAVQVEDRNRDQTLKRYERWQKLPKEDQLVTWILSRTEPDPPGNDRWWTEPERDEWREWEFADRAGTPAFYDGPRGFTISRSSVAARRRRLKR